MADFFCTYYLTTVSAFYFYFYETNDARRQVCDLHHHDACSVGAVHCCIEAEYTFITGHSIAAGSRKESRAGLFPTSAEWMWPIEHFTHSWPGQARAKSALPHRFDCDCNQKNHIGFIGFHTFRFSGP